MSKQGTVNFNSLPKEVRADRRRQAFALFDRGDDLESIAHVVGVHERSIERWLKNRKRYEVNDYQEEKRGNPQDQRRLTPKQDKELLQIIKTSTPDIAK